MAEGPRYGASSGDWEDAIRRVEQMGRSNQEMRQKEEARQQTEEKGRVVDERSARQREGMADATSTLTGRITANAEAIRAETAALEANIAIMSRAVGLRREMAGIPVTGATGRTAAAAEAASGGATGVVGGTASGEAELERMRQQALADERAMLQARAQQAAQAGAAVRARGPLTLPPASYVEAGGIGSTGSMAEAPGGARARYLPPGQQALPPAWQYGAYPRVTSGGPAESIGLGGFGAEEAQHIAAVRAEAGQTATTLEKLGNTQEGVNARMVQANSIFAENSTRLSRHGALTTEFIQALAQGQVTLGEFGSQMTSVIGKFGGWLIAGAAVYGVYDMFKHLTQGATESQAAIQQLGRFLPGLGGPAGGGSGNVSAAYGMVRGLSTQFNVPISEVSDSAQIMARLFGSGPNPLGNTQQGTAAVLAASRLDQVAPNVATQYLTGIAQSMGFLGKPDAGKQMVGVVNSLNALQSQYGARVAETLPALARAAPAAYAAGVSNPELEAMVGLGVRSGIPGTQVSTALLRSMSTFAFRSSSQEMLRSYGLNPQLGQYGDLMGSVFGMIDRRASGRGASGPLGGGPLSGVDLRNLALAIGGPLLGARTLLPMLAAEQRYPGLYGQMLGTAQRPRPYQEDLNAVLGTVGERFKSIGITLQNFGSQLAQGGMLAPLTGLLNTFNLVAHVAESLVAPFAGLFSVVNQLPGPLRDMLGLFIAFRAARYLADTRFGSAAQTAVGRLPGLQFLRNDSREAVMGLRSTLQREVLPQQELDAERASGAYRVAARRAQLAVGAREQFQAANLGAAGMPTTATERQAYEEQLSKLVAAEKTATDKALAAEEEYASLNEQAAQTQALINIAKDKQLSAAEKAAVFEAQGWGVASALPGRRDLTAQYTTAFRQQAAGGSMAGGLGTEAIAAGATIAVGAAVNEFANNGAAQDTLRRGMTSSGLLLPPGAETGAPMVVPPRPPTGPDVTRTPVMPLGERVSVVPGMAQAEVIGQRVTQALEPMTARIGQSLTGGLGMPLGGYGTAARGMLGGFVSGPYAPMAALMGTQMLGSAIGGGVGSYIQTVGGQAAAGGMIASMLGKSMAGGAAIGTVLGAFQQGTGAGVGSLAGGGIGMALGSLVGSPLIGGLIGSQVGSFIGNLISPSQSPTDQTTQGSRQALINLRRAGLLPGAAGLPIDISGSASLSANTPYGAATNQALGDMLTAMIGSGASQQKAQASIGPQMQGLQSLAEIYGPQSKRGQGALTGLQLLTQAATGQLAQMDPQAAQQIVQQLTQSHQKLLQSAFTNQMSGETGFGDIGAAQQYADQYQSLMVGPWYQSFLDAQESLHQANVRMTAALKTKNHQQIAAAQKGLSQARDEYDAARGAYSTAQQSATPAEQQAYQQAYQQGSQQQQAATAYGQAAAGGNVAKQLQAQLEGAQKTLRGLDAAGPSKLGAAFYSQQYNQLQATIMQVQTQQAQQGLAELQSRGTLAVSEVPLGHPVEQALVQAQQYTKQVQYMRDHAKDFDPSQIKQAQAQANDAWKQVAQQYQDYNTQMNDIRTQTQVARDYGDAVKQAQDQLAGAMRDLSFARTPAARAQAQSNIAQFQGAVQQAQFSRIGQEAQLRAAQLWSDPVAAAGALLTGAQQQMSAAHGIDQQIQAQQNFAQAQQAQHQAVVQLIQAQGQLQQSLYPGDPVRQAQVAITTAGHVLSVAKGTFEQTQAEAQLNAANYQLAQALSQRQVSLGQLSASETVDPVQALYRTLQGYTKALKTPGLGPGDRVQLETQKNSTLHQYEQSLIDQREAAIDFQYQMMQITAQQAIAQLTALEHMKGITKAQLQQIKEQVRRYSLGEVSPIGGQGGFDLAPGNIRLPTFYDVQHALRGGRPAAMATAMAVNNATQINVYVKNAGDVPKVAEVLDRVTSGHLRTRLRAAGVTA